MRRCINMYLAVLLFDIIFSRITGNAQEVVELVILRHVDESRKTIGVRGNKKRTIQDEQNED